MTTVAARDWAAPIDPLGEQPDGTYRDDLVTVTRAGQEQRPPPDEEVRTDSFSLAAGHDPVRLWHRVPAEEVDDDLAGRINEELFRPGWLRGPELFERLFTGVVRSSVPGALPAWDAFYRNTVARIAAEEGVSTGSTAGTRHGSIAGYAPVHDHAADLVVGGSVLELGSCFGFLSLRLAARGLVVTASDVVPGTMRLLAAVAPRLGVDLRTAVGDAARVDLPDRAADTVLAVHLLEHLEPDHGDAVLAEALRLAARRVVVAVPLEEVADETYGHVRTVSLDDLTVWGVRTGLPFDVHEHHGGWLVIDL